MKVASKPQTTLEHMLKMIHILPVSLSVLLPIFIAPMIIPASGTSMDNTYIPTLLSLDCV